MNNRENISKKIRDLTAMLDPSEAPGVYNYLCGCISGEAEPDLSAMHIVYDLRGMEPLPQLVWAFIFELLEEEVGTGNTDAMNELGMMYHDGIGCDVNFEKAVALFHLAAEKGDRHAAENLGYCYYYGRNMPVDYEKAFHYFALGAFEGRPVSLYKIGDMYMNGYYVPKNEKEAFLIYDRCLHTMTDEDARFAAGPVYLRLGNALLAGKGTGANAENALFCFQKAEAYLYDMVMKGDFQYKKSLFSAIEGQQKAREALLKKLPAKDWTFDD